MYSETFTKEQENKFKELRKGKTEQSIINFINKFINKKPSDQDFRVFMDLITESDEVFTDFVIFIDCFHRNSISFRLIHDTIIWALKCEHIKYKQYYRRVTSQKTKLSQLLKRKEIRIGGIPDHLILNTTDLRIDIIQQSNDADKKYKCRGCKKTFLGREIQYEKIPDNFHIVGVEDNQKMAKCPHCGDIAFFGFINAEGE